MQFSNISVWIDDAASASFHCYCRLCPCTVYRSGSPPARGRGSSASNWHTPSISEQRSAYFSMILRVDGHAGVSKSHDQFKMNLCESRFRHMCGLQTIYQFSNCVDRPSKTRLLIMSATLFREHCCHVCFAFGAGRNGQNGLLSRKCPQAGSVCKQKKSVLFPFLLVIKGTTPTNQKMIWQSMWFGCWGTGEVVGRTVAKEWQQQWWW